MSAAAVERLGCPCAGCTRGLAAFTVEHFRVWAAALELDNGEPWVLEPWQQSFAADVFAGFMVCWLVVPEGNGKTTFVAGLALYHIQHTTSGYVPVAASARDQAEWIYRQAEGFVLRSGPAKTLFKCLEGYRRIRYDGLGARIQVFAADDRSGDGIIPTLAVLDELHRHRDLALYRTWVGKLRKRGGQLVVISTAGEVGGEFEEERARMRQTATASRSLVAFTRAERTLEGKRLSVLHEYAVPEDGNVDDLALVKAANPHGGVTLESLAEKKELPGMTPQHWSRFTCNLAARSGTAAITEAEWADARHPDGWPDGEQVWLGLDMGWKYDTTAAVPLLWRSETERILGPACVLTPPRNGDSLDPHLVERTLLEIHRRTPVATVVMDASHDEQMAHWIRDTLGCRVIERGQTNSFFAMDYSRFMEALRNGWLKHTGDQALTRHALNAAARVLPNGDIRFDRPSQSRFGRQRVQQTREIDALVAAAMVHTTAQAEMTVQPKLYRAAGFN